MKAEHKKQRSTYTYVRVLVSLMIIAFLVFKLDLDLSELAGGIRAPLFLVLALLSPLIINPIISNNRWKAFLSAQGIQEGFFNLARIGFVSVFLGIFLPAQSGSDAIRMYMIEKRHKDKTGMGGAAVIIERLLGFYILSCVGIVGAILTLHKGLPSSILISVLAVNLVIAGFMLLLQNKRLVDLLTGHINKIKFFKKAVDYLLKLFNALHCFPLRKTIVTTVFLILLFQLSNILCAFLIFKAFGIDIPFYYHLLFMPLIQIISVLPISIAGFGLREGGFVYFYGLVGVNKSTSFSVSLTYYLVLMLVPAFVGMILYLLGRTHTDKDKLLTV